VPTSITADVSPNKKRAAVSPINKLSQEQPYEDIQITQKKEMRPRYQPRTNSYSDRTIEEIATGGRE
jgi:hypothetical protein